jgi:hypothetical protein
MRGEEGVLEHEELLFSADENGTEDALEHALIVAQRGRQSMRSR